MTTPEAVGTYELVKVKDLVPNDWNPNRQSDYMYERELASIRKFGFVVPVIIRLAKKGRKTVREIVDGEHRWRGAKELGYSSIPAYNLGDVSRETAMQMTIAFNEIKGRPEAHALAEMLTELERSNSLEDLAAVLPYRPAELEALLELADGPDLTADLKELEKTLKQPDPRTTLAFAFTPDQLHIVTDAMDKALGKRAKSDADRGYTLELIAADYLAGGDPDIIEDTVAHAVAEICRIYLAGTPAAG